MKLVILWIITFQKKFITKNQKVILSTPKVNISSVTRMYKNVHQRTQNNRKGNHTPQTLNTCYQCYQMLPPKK